MTITNQDLIAFWNEKNKNRCVICNEQKWTLIPDGRNIATIVLLDDDEVRKGSYNIVKGIQTYTVMCVNCGHYNFMDRNVIINWVKNNGK